MLITNIFSFSQNVFYFSQTKFSFSITFILSSANALSLDQCKVLSFGEELKCLLCERGENVMGKECFVKEEKMLWEKNAL